MILSLGVLWSVTVAGLAARLQLSDLPPTSVKEMLLSWHTPEDGSSTTHWSAGGSPNPPEEVPHNALVGELVARRRHLIGKNLRGELTFKDIVDHAIFIKSRVQDSFKLLRELMRRHRLILARMNRRKDIGNFFALNTQGEKVEDQVALMINNTRALFAEKDWLIATEGFKETQRQLCENLVKTASGELILKSQLEEDKALFADDGESLFENLLQSMKDEDASAARAPEGTTKHVSDEEDTKLKVKQLESRSVNLFGSKLQVA